MSQQRTALSEGAGVTAKSLTLDADADKQVRIEMVDLGRDLWKEKDALIDDLSRVVRVA